MGKPFIRLAKLAGSIFYCIVCVSYLHSNTVVEQVEEYINGIESLSAEFNQTTSNSNDSDKGSINIKRKNKNAKTEVQVNYNTGVISSMSLNGRFMTVVYRKTGKSKTYSILTTPIYAILAGELKLKEFTHQTIEDAENYAIIRIMYEKQIFDLGVSKKNKKVNRILYWTLYNGGNWTNVEFDDTKYYVNEMPKSPKDKN